MEGHFRGAAEESLRSLEFLGYEKFSFQPSGHGSGGTRILILELLEAGSCSLTCSKCENLKRQGDRTD